MNIKVEAICLGISEKLQVSEYGLMVVVIISIF